MSDLETKAYRMLKEFLRGENKSIEKIREAIDTILEMSIFKESNIEDIKNTIYDEYITNIGIVNPDAEFLVKNKDFNNWMKLSNVSTNCFDRYMDYLRDMDFPEDSIEKMTKATNDILARCADPNNLNDHKNSKKKGLVMGDIQSGKTANYTALINLAADYGYKVIVLLAGMTDSLREQTQKRIDSGFIGAKSDTISSSIINFVGVGKEENKYYAIPLTNVNSDFGKVVRENQNTNSSDFNKPLILVIKKNKSVLTQVKDYLKPGIHGITSENILIIDDEADNASVNTKNSDDPSIINKLIRDLFNNFTIASYVGFTATPFANIFINPYDDDFNKDLFPSDFIVQLKEPSSYFGANKVFNNLGSIDEPKYKHIEILDPHEKNFLLLTHKKDDEIFSVLPDSLKKAINDFIIVNVIRTLRGKEFKHRTMMINISRFNAIQYKIYDKINDYIDLMKNTISQTYKSDFNNFIRDPYMNDLYEEYNDEFFSEIREEFTWDQIQEGLNNEIQQFIVTVVNNNNKKNRFNYDNYEKEGARVIAIGGFILSRGLTLEGLMISYFNRKANAYDTILQMCRWFGYRPGYEDLCRIYMTQENIDNFEDVIDAVSNLKEQFKQMDVENKTPEDFGLMVKQSPARLNMQMFISSGEELEKFEKMGITAKNKMRNTEEKIITLNYSGIATDTSKLFNDKAKNEENKNTIDLLFKSLKDKELNLEYVNGRLMVQRIPKDVISDFINKFKLPFLNKSFDTESLSEYIKNSVFMPEWDLVIATGSKNDNDYWNFEDYNIPVVTRSFDMNYSDNIIRISGNKNRLYEPGIFNSGLNDEQLSQANKNMVYHERKNLIAEDYLNIQRRPLLVIYPIRLKKKKNSSINDSEMRAISNFNNGTPLFGIALGFPGIKTNERVSYRLNKVKIEQLSLDFEYEEEYDPNED